MTAAPYRLVEADPFGLPAWLGERDVVWRPDHGLRTGHLVEGRLSAPGAVHVEPLTCDLLAVDDAYPVPATTSEARVQAHQLWQHGQVLVAMRDSRLTLAAPGTHFTADLVLDCLDRLALAVGASPDHFSALLRVGQRHQRSRRPTG